MLWPCNLMQHATSTQVDWLDGCNRSGHPQISEYKLEISSPQFVLSILWLTQENYQAVIDVCDPSYLAQSSAHCSASPQLLVQKGSRLHGHAATLSESIQ